MPELEENTNDNEEEIDYEEKDILHEILSNTVSLLDIHLINKYLDIQMKFIELLEDDELLNDIKNLSREVITIYLLVCDILYKSRIYYKKMDENIDKIPIELRGNYEYCFSKIKNNYDYFIFEAFYLNLFFRNLILQIERDSFDYTSNEMFRVYNFLIE